MSTEESGDSTSILLLQSGPCNLGTLYCFPWVVSKKMIPLSTPI